MSVYTTILLKKIHEWIQCVGENEFDTANFQPLLFQVPELTLSPESDPYLWSVVEDGIAVLKSYAGIGETWEEVVKAPPHLFMIDEERRRSEDARKERRSLLHGNPLMQSKRKASPKKKATKRKARSEPHSRTRCTKKEYNRERL